MWRVFHILAEPVRYMFVSVNRRNNEAHVHIAMRDRTSLFRRITTYNSNIFSFRFVLGIVIACFSIRIIFLITKSFKLILVAKW